MGQSVNQSKWQASHMNYWHSNQTHLISILLCNQEKNINQPTGRVTPHGGKWCSYHVKVLFLVDIQKSFPVK